MNELTPVQEADETLMSMIPPASDYKTASPIKPFNLNKKLKPMSTMSPSKRDEDSKNYRSTPASSTKKPK